jgi:diguanylate cyclase (GGDEF)-like protein
VEFVSKPSASVSAESAFERRAIGRVAAGIWAAIAFFGAVATVKPLRFPEADLSSMRVVVVAATVIAAVTLALPWTRVPKAFLNLLLVLMAGFITALATASGAVDTGPMMLVTFGVALAVCFLPVRTGTIEVVMIAVLLGAGLVLLDKDNAGVTALRTSLLLSVLVVLCGLVLVLRAVIAQREAEVGRRLFEEDVLEERGFRRTLERELSRANRHERPVSLVLLDVPGLLDPAALSPADDRLVTDVGHAILERLRLEDSAGHLGVLRFGLIAPETAAEGAAGVAETVTEVVRDVIRSHGHDMSRADVAVGWAEFPHHAKSAEELLSAASENLEAAAVANELRPSRTIRETSPQARPAAAGPEGH